MGRSVPGRKKPGQEDREEGVTGDRKHITDKGVQNKRTWPAGGRSVGESEAAGS